MGHISQIGVSEILKNHQSFGNHLTYMTYMTYVTSVLFISKSIFQ